MPKYRVKELSYINDLLVQPGTEIGDGTAIPFSGKPGPHMEPLDKAAEKAAADAKAFYEGKGADYETMTDGPYQAAPLNDAKPAGVQTV